MDVYILRHGKAGEAGPDTADADRQLTKKGREEIGAAGRWMAGQELAFDLIASSPLARAQETAAIVADHLGETDRLVTWKALSPGGSPETVCRLLGKHPDAKAILLVGHEPLLSALVSRIISGTDTASIAMTKGSLAKIRNFSFSLGPSGELHWLLIASQMDGMR